jgi:hypothetical protein
LELGGREGRKTMKKGILSIAKVAGLFLAAALMASCYAPLANQKGYVSLNVSGAKTGPSGSSQVVVLVVNSDSADTFRETLNLISKAYNNSGTLVTADADRLKTLGQQLATGGLVKFGGFPFLQTTISGSQGTFDIPGIPAGRDYFVKLYVFQPGFDFKPENIDQNFGNLIQLQNKVFTTEKYASPTGWQTWVPVGTQPVTVKEGESTTVSINLTLQSTVTF